MSTPCHNCKNRHCGCHSVCELYLEYSKKQEELRDKRFKEKDSERWNARCKNWRKR